MTGLSTHNPAEPVVDDGSYGGFTAIAQRLSEMHPERARPFSRQLVHRWYLKRDYNDFPEALPVRARSGKIKLWFRLEAVDEWHHSYRQHRRLERPPIETIPLFELDRGGNLVC
jgi:hypothetical protein